MDAEKRRLWAIFNELVPDDRVLLTDTFTLLCFLHKQGNAVAAVKLMRDVFMKINIQRETMNLCDEESFLNSVLCSLEGNENSLGLAVSSRAEVADLLRD